MVKSLNSPPYSGAKIRKPVHIELLSDIRQMINETQDSVAASVNSGLVLLNWNIGTRIRQEILKGERAKYGEEILATLSQQLTEEYGRRFDYSSLTRMIKFAEAFPEKHIVGTLSRTLSWSHFKELLPLERPYQRDFYAELCRIERWSVRTLRQRISSMLYERTSLSKKSDELVSIELDSLRNQDKLTPDLVFRDPYLLDFLGLKDTYHEKDLEAAILRELETFLLELGVGFTFVARQKRISIDQDDYYLDLLFFHRDLRRLVAVELKLDMFSPSHMGQMELYLRWLDRYERKPDEEAPLGIILCAGKKQEQIELLELGRSGIHVAEYLTTLPPKDVLQKKLQSAITFSRKRISSNSRSI